MLMNSNEYITVVDNIKKEIRSAQYRTAVQANTELLRLYYSIGKEINVHKIWGNKFIENLSMDIRADYPTNKGFSVRNLKYMAKFAATYSEQEFVQQAVAQIPWGHNIVLLDKITDNEQRRWYAEACQKNGWSRNVLIHQIESGLYERQVLNSKVSNFKQRLPSPQSELATQTMKDPYVFDFIPFRADMLERDIEQALVVSFSSVGISSMMSPISQFSVLHTFIRTSMLTVSPFESLVTEAQLIPAAACKSFFFMSLSINIFHNFL